MISTLLWILLILHPPTNTTHTFKRSGALEVQALATSGTPISGVTVQLCPFDGSTLGSKMPSDACRTQISDADGECRYRGIEPGTYTLSGELDGFASTAVYPLSIGAEDPIAPDQVFLVLNPVCWDC